ncbi:MAG: carboxysome shell protein [Gammaproteobacteria bacterium]|nr:carboxysome shell protein [Gammaproteobacteria bacterium]
MQSSGVTATAATSAPATSARSTATGSVVSSSARKASLARRQAMSTGGKAAFVSKDRTRGDEMVGKLSSTPSATMTSPATTQTASSTPEKRDCGCGCNGEKSTAPAMTAPAVQVRAGKKVENPTRAASLARRQAMSSRGKAAISGKGPSAAQTARASNPNISSRELAQTIREERSTKGKCKTGSADSKCRPTGRMRPGKEKPAAAQDAPWKVGASETTHGQTVTGTMVGRSVGVTGDEPSTCRAITGTEYLGADIFREFCQSEASKSPRKVRVTSTATGNAVSGNELGRSGKVTGDEPGTCKRVTGVQYVGAGQMQEFCGTTVEAGPTKFSIAETRKGKTVTGNNVGRSNKVTGDERGSNRELTGTSVMQLGEGSAPAKVGKSATLRGGSVTGTIVGRNQNVTGDEPGSCRNVTGDDYIGAEQYTSFCNTTPKATDRKVGVSATLKNKAVTGTMTGRDGKVTGDEPGTCKAVTGTPYAGAETYKDFCDTDSVNQARARTQPRRMTPGMPMTGIQPGIGGKLTGAGRGACEPLTGTPYVGADQFANACPSVPADSSSPDFPQPIGGTAWGQFSVSAPNHASQTSSAHSAVTGTQYEKGNITGPFGMAGGKVTGTEEARFGHGAGAPAPTYTAQLVDERVKGRITGEGQDAGLRITGDDWDRNARVTGTEGLSATRRNPTRRGSSDAMAMQLINKRNEELPTPNSKVTGSSGNTEKGSLITYSGGARG